MRTDTVRKGCAICQHGFIYPHNTYEITEAYCYLGKEALDEVEIARLEKECYFLKDRRVKIDRRKI